MIFNSARSFLSKEASSISASPLKEHTAQVLSQHMLFELFANVSFDNLEGDSYRRRRNLVQF